MANPFLSSTCRDVETAILLEQAVIHDIGTAVAYTDGEKVFINTDDNLYNILPAYDNNMLKWILWHEKYHKELNHHKRFYKYINNHKDREKSKLTLDEVNIIMDILVHDSLTKLFPELIDTAISNFAQMRNRNSLGYTFKTVTLEEMLNEYELYKQEQDSKGEESKENEGSEEKDTDDSTSSSEDSSGSSSEDTPDKESESPSDKSDKGTSHSESHADKKEKKDKHKMEDEHHKTNWDKLRNIDTKEFIDEYTAAKIEDSVNRLKAKKLRLGRVTQTLNGLVTTTRERTYSMPSHVHVSGNVILKGRKPGRADLYLCFDASGSMDREMNLFKDIISKSIPQARKTPTTWFSGYISSDTDIDRSLIQDKEGRDNDYYKGTFEDFMNVQASCGYSDDGDRTIELCWKAEKLGYSPIGITDGGGQIDWSRDMLKQLKRTVFIGQNKEWLETAKEINPLIHTLYI